MPAVIAGTGVAVPPNLVTNDHPTRIMDTTDEWIRSRTGVASRRFVDPGTGTSDLAAEAARAALADAGVDASEVDAVVCATMTPDRQNPGIAGAVQRKTGLDGAAVFDLRQQCAGFLFGLDLADMLIATGQAGTVVVAGAEVHAGYLPWGTGALGQHHCGHPADPLPRAAGPGPGDAGIAGGVHQLRSRGPLGRGPLPRTQDTGPSVNAAPVLT